MGSDIFVNYIMKSLIFVIAFLAAAQAAPSKPLTIVGGEDAEDGEFPWQVQLRSSDSGSSLFCGGWVLNENWVGTAAHCCTGSLPRGIHVVAGGILRKEDDEGEEQFSDVTEIVIHEEYSNRNHENDICLLHLKTALNMTDFVQPVTLPAQMELTPEGTDCIVTGWGTLHSGDFLLPDKLQKVTVPVVGDATCSDKYGPRYEITDSMICAGVEEGGKDSCQGDSGGPMIDAETKALVGVVSWGIGCAEAKHPGVYTEVAYYVDWINEKVAA